jgi:tetratricopeptide (TPR) repeat protein
MRQVRKMPEMRVKVRGDRAGRPTSAGLARVAIACCLLVTTAACATRPAPAALPTATKHPEFMFPAVPQPLQRGAGVESIERGWRYLQNDDFREASREFAAALKQNPGLYPAQTGEAYVALARRDHDRAAAGFDAALSAAPTYVPALVGKGQTLLALKREADALATFEAALKVDPSLADIQRRVEVLRFRNVQQVIEAARAAASAGRLDDARVAYEHALATSPDSAFLHRELAIVDRRQGNVDSALGHFARAIELDPADAVSLIETGDLLARRQDFAGAEAAYRKAAAVEATAELTAKIAATAEAAREAKLPAPFKAIPTLAQVTRGDLAALIGVRLERVLATVPERQVVITDTRGHWAASYITQVARAGVIEPFENHTFQPGAPVRRGDLAAAVSRTLTILAEKDPSLRKRLTERAKIADMTVAHLSYPAASTAVAAGVMPLDAEGRFQVNRVVTGAEALEVVERLRALVR